MNFYIATVSIEEIGTGILKENDCAVLTCGLKKCFSLQEIAEHYPIGKISVGEGSCFVEKNRLLYIDKRNNPDIVKTVRTALTFEAMGIIIPFGNNKNRPYIKEGRAYTTAEMQSAIREARRMCPLFGRKFSETEIN